MYILDKFMISGSEPGVVLSSAEEAATRQSLMNSY